MFGNLVWLFPEYRDLMLENQRLLRVVTDLEGQLAARSLPTPEAAGDFLKQYVDTILQEEPYPDGKIPDTAWLTPGEGERVKVEAAG